MSISSYRLQQLTATYPEHIWISTEVNHAEINLSQSALNQLCIDRVSEHLTKSLDLTVELAFPSESKSLLFISKLVNGFVLSISDIRIAFIPTQDLDLMGFEVPQEWVDLSNWAADYYVPIQIDLDGNYLHLWGFISHQYLQQRAILDRCQRVYEVASSDLVSDLDLLWIACDLVCNGSIAPERGTIPQLTLLSQLDAQRSIDRLKQHRSIFSPRLVLPFEQWGAIINSPEYLTIYQNPALAITQITNWFNQERVSVAAAVESHVANLVDNAWLKITDVFNQSAPLSGYFTNPIQQSQLTTPGSSVDSQQEVNRAVHHLYASQSSPDRVNLPTDMNSPIDLLVYLMQHTTDETLRWQAAEYLWTIAPNESSRNELAGSEYWHRRIKDLGLVIQGHKLGLMVAVVPLLDQAYAILTRVYPLGTKNYLPPNVKLSLLSENGEQLCQTNSRITVMDSYIQLYFTANLGDRFNVWIEIDQAKIVEAFAI
jgi:Protein of unknown function (DUF1822)